MTTNRLQPDSMIQESDCAALRPSTGRARRATGGWNGPWRGEYLPAKRDEYNMIRHALENEKFPGKGYNAPMRPFRDLPPDEQADITRKRLQIYSQKVYHKIHGLDHAGPGSNHLPAREPVLHQHRPGLPRQTVRLQGQGQGLEGQDRGAQVVGRAGSRSRTPPRR